MDYALPIGIALAAWWVSTVLVLYRSGMPRGSFGTTLLGATAAMLLGVYALLVSRSDTSAIGAYLAFFGSLAIYGWHEVSYLFGFVTGPRPEPCPPDTDGWQRFVFGVKTCAYHELAIVATAGLIAVLSWDAVNQVGLWTFCILWLMRWSAKLNIFLGVRNLHAEFWPEHLGYLNSYARQRSMNALFPISIIASMTGVALLVVAAVHAGPDSAQRAGALLLATLLALAAIEHWFLIIRIPDEVIWQPGLRSRSDPDVARIPAKIRSGT